LHDAQVSGAVTVLEDALLQASNNTISGNVRGIDRTRGVEDTTIRLAANNIGGNVEATGVGLLRITNTLFGRPVNSPNTVGGSVVAKEGSNVLICGTSLPTGSIQVKGQTVQSNADIGGGACIPSDSNPSLGGGNTLNGGSIQVAQNEFQSEALGLDLSNNHVAQDIQVLKNTGVGQKRVQNNTVGGNLQCKRNEQPFIGKPNTVAGTVEGQCAPS
jgi:hypothetical protein